MSWFVAAIYDRFLQTTEAGCLHEWRGQLLRRTRGAVVELGAGTGLNLAHYPLEVEELCLVEPDKHMRTKLNRRLQKLSLACPSNVFDAHGHALPFESGRFDFAVSSMVLCTVLDPMATLRELRRVLKTDGKLIFLEHVAAWNNPSRLRWQKMAEPFWRWVAGGCHLTRDTESAIAAAGYTIEECTRESARKALPILRPSIRGVAAPKR